MLLQLITICINNSDITLHCLVLHMDEVNNSCSTNKCTIPHYVRKVAVHLQKVLEVMSTSVYTGLNRFDFILKYFLQICVQKVAVHL
jgi:hypothetical protein